MICHFPTLWTLAALAESHGLRKERKNRPEGEQVSLAVGTWTKIVHMKDRHIRARWRGKTRVVFGPQGPHGVPGVVVEAYPHSLK